MDRETVENQFFGNKNNENLTQVFGTKGSQGANNVELARILTAFELAVSILGWQNKPVAELIKFCTQYQASINTQYHNDYVKVLVAEEIERRREERKGISILSQ